MDSLDEKSVEQIHSLLKTKILYSSKSKEQMPPRFSDVYFFKMTEFFWMPFFSQLHKQFPILWQEVLSTFSYEIETVEIADVTIQLYALHSSATSKRFRIYF